MFFVSMQKNLIYISQFCRSNKVSIEFSPTSFLVKGLHTETMLLRGCTKDGVYKWPTSSPSIAFLIIKTTSFDWHHRLGRLVFPILKHIVSNNHFVLSSLLSHNFTYNAYLYNKSHKLSFFQLYNCLYITP